MISSLRFLYLAIILVSCLKANPRSHTEKDKVSPNDWSKENASDSNPKDEICFFADNEASFSRDILPILKKYCISCHSSKSPAGGITLESYSDPNSFTPNLERWQNVGSQISKGTMPPQGLPTLNKCERALWDQWLISLAQNQTNSDQDVQDSVDPRDPFDSAPLQRLSKVELENSLQDLFGIEVANLLKPKLQNVPEDDKSGGFENFNWSLSPDHINAYFDIATLAADLVVSDPNRLRLLEQCLTAQVIEDECVKSFIKSFGLRVFRRAIDKEEINSFMDIYKRYSTTGASDGIATIIRMFLQSPLFIYKFEIDGDQRQGTSNVFMLSQYEIASRLSFTLLRSSPDIELLRLAEKGELADEAVIRRQIERLMLDERAKKMVHSFFSQWLRLNSLPELRYSNEFRGEIVTDTLRDDAIAETLWFVDHMIWEKKATYRDLLLSRLAFIPSVPLAQTYGIQPSASPIELPLNTRRGLLTRTGLLLSGHDEVSPIHRGSFIRSQLLCDVLLSPDPQELPPGSLSPPNFDPTMSTRERWERKTDSPVCQSCHAKMNPLGFAFGNFDGLGRFVDQDRVLDPNGKLVNILPINSSAIPELSSGDVERVVGPLELTELFANNSKSSECFVRQWFRFSFQRRETASDRKVINALIDEMQNSGEGIKGMIKKTLLLPENRMRTIGQ